MVASDYDTTETDHYTDARIEKSHIEKLELKKLPVRQKKVSNEKLDSSKETIDCQTVPWRRCRAVDFSHPMTLTTRGKTDDDAVKYTSKKLQQVKNKNISKRTSGTEDIVLKTVPETRKKSLDEELQVVKPFPTMIQKIISENVTLEQQTISDVVQDKKQISSISSEIVCNLNSNLEIIPSHVDQISNVSCEESETPHIDVESSFTESQHVTPQSKRDLKELEKNEPTPSRKDKIFLKKLTQIKPKFLEEKIEPVKLKKTRKIENMFIKQKNEQPVEHSVEKLPSISDNITKSEDKKLKSKETNLFLPVDKHESSVSKLEKLESAKQEKTNARFVMKGKKLSSPLRAPVEEKSSNDSIFGESSKLKSEIKFPETAQQQSSVPSNISLEKPISETLEVKSEDTENETKKHGNWILQSAKKNDIISMKHQLEIKPNVEERKTLTERPDFSNNDHEFKNQESTIEDNLMENTKLDLQPKIANNSADMALAKHNQPSKKICRPTMRIKSHAADDLKELENRKQKISGQELSANIVENGKQKLIISEKKKQILEPAELDDVTEVMKIQDIVSVKNISEKKVLKQDKPTTKVEKVAVDMMEEIEHEQQHLHEEPKDEIIGKQKLKKESIQNINLTKNTRQKSTKKRPNEKSIDQHEYQIKKTEKRMAQYEIVNDSLVTNQPTVPDIARTAENNTSIDEIGIIHSLNEATSSEKHGTLIDQPLKRNIEKIDDFGTDKLTLLDIEDNLEELHLEHVHKGLQKGKN